MSNTPPKFRIPETASETDPTVGVAEAWGVFDAVYLANMPGIVSVIHGVMAQGFKNWAAGNNQPFNEPLILEKALTKAHPEFMIATQGLKKAFDKVQGWESSGIIGSGANPSTLRKLCLANT